MSYSKGKVVQRHSFAGLKDHLLLSPLSTFALKEFEPPFGANASALNVTLLFDEHLNGNTASATSDPPLPSGSHTYEFSKPLFVTATKGGVTTEHAVEYTSSLLQLSKS